METTSTRPRRTARLRRTLGLAAGAVGVALLLSGCIKLDMAMTLTPENTMDGTIVFAVDKTLLTLGGGTPEDAFKDAEGQAPFPTSPASGSVTTEVYDQDGKYGQKYTFVGVPISTFDDPDLSITREGDYFLVRGTLDMSSSTGSGGSASEPPLPSSLTQGFDIAVSMTFPGEVLEHNGSLEGTTVTWKPTSGQKTAISAKARATPGSTGLLGFSSASSSTPMLVGLGVAALVLLGAVVALLLRRGRAPALAGAAGGAVESDAGAVPGFAPVAPDASGAPSQVVGTSAPDAGWAPPPVLPAPPDAEEPPTGTAPVATEVVPPEPEHPDAPAPPAPPA